MTAIDDLLAANQASLASHVHLPDARPARRLVVLTCMDARIDVFAVLGLRPGDAHVLRNAGGRVTDDVLRSLAVSSHVLGTDTLVVMQHTMCGMVGVSDEELQRLTAADLEFLTIDDHATALQHDVDQLRTTPYLERVDTIAGLLYDLESGRVDAVTAWHRDRD
jgi:carbonic anhydrase